MATSRKQMPIDSGASGASPTRKRKAGRGRTRRRRQDLRVVDGLLLLDKPVGITSNEALQRAKRLFEARKAGHTGSLDPLASGMLPLCFGQATKVSAFLLGADKVYRVRARFGSRTDTADADGKVVEESRITEVSQIALETALSKFRGDIQQVPPMYSALRKDGRRLYELAREGREVEREPRPVTIHSLDIEEYDPTHPVLRVRCSKGTYVRTLVEDIAAAAGTLGHVAALRRLTVEPFPDDGLVSLTALEQAAEAGGMEALDRFLLPIDAALDGWPSIYLTKDEAYYVRQGHPVHTRVADESGRVRIYDEARRFLGIGEVLRDGRLAPKRLFVEQPGTGG